MTLFHLPDDTLALIFTYLDTPSLLQLHTTCKAIHASTTPHVPHGVYYASPYLPGDTVAYPYVTRGGKKFLDPTLQKALKNGVHHYTLFDRFVSTTRDPYVRLWVWRQITHRQGTPPPNFHKSHSGVIVPSNTQWCCVNVNQLQCFAKRAPSAIKWLHLKSFPNCPGTLSELLKSSADSLQSILFQGLHHSLDVYTAVVNANPRVLRSFVVKNYYWSYAATKPLPVKKIKLKNCVFSSPEVLATLLRAVSQVSDLCLEHVNVCAGRSDDVLAQDLPEFGALESLQLVNLHISPQVCHSLSSCICRLSRLSVRETPLKSYQLDAFLQHQKNLVALDLSRNELCSECLTSIGQVLSSSTCKLQKVVLSYNFITSTGVKEFVTALQTNTTLRHLDLSDNFLRFPGYTALFNFLNSKRPQWKYLDISGNQICLGNDYSEFFVYDVGVLLSNCRSLRTLRLAQNAFVSHDTKKHFEQQFLSEFQVSVTL